MDPDVELCVVCREPLVPNEHHNCKFKMPGRLVESRVLVFKESGKFGHEFFIKLPAGIPPYKVREHLEKMPAMHGWHVCFPDSLNPWGYPQLVLNVRYVLNVNSKGLFVRR